MPDTFHPLLSEQDEDKEQQEDTPVAEPQGEENAESESTPVVAEAEQEDTKATEGGEATVDEGQDAKVEPSEAEQAESEPEQPKPEKPDNVIALDRSNLYGEIARLDREVPEFREALRTYGGRKVKRELEGRIDLLEAELQAREAELAEARVQNQIYQMLSDPNQGEAAVHERLRTDPEFARAYHSQAEKPDLEEIQAAVETTNYIEDILEQGLQAGIPPRRIDEYRQAIQTGWFDYRRDAQGRPIGEMVGGTEALLILQQTINAEAAAARARQQQATAPRQEPKQPQPAAAPAKQEERPVAQQEKPAPQPNPALTARGPDLSSGQSASASGGKISYEEYMSLTPPERIERYPGGLEELVRKGLVTGIPSRS